MKEYIDLIKNIRNHGFVKGDRTGVGSRSVVGAQMRMDLSSRFPALNVRRVAPRIAFEELIFMLNGKSQTKELENKNINIWKGNTSNEFQKKVGLSYLQEGDFGVMYGVQMRRFGLGPRYKCNISDQLKYVVDELKNNPLSRRIIITQYNPCDVKMGVLFPCHIMTQFIVTGDKLNLVYWMRSSDTIYGLPYNNMYYAFFLLMMAHMLGFDPGDLVYQAGDAHVYNNQSEIADKMIARYEAGEVSSLPNPTVELTKEINSLDSLLQYKWEDVIIHDYEPLDDFKDKPPMAV